MLGSNKSLMTSAARLPATLRGGPRLPLTPTRCGGPMMQSPSTVAPLLTLSAR
jgi:hypothetical protein